MTRAARMKRIAMMSRNNERAAAQSLSTSQQQLDAYQKQLNDLVTYREEYRASLRSKSAAPMNGFEAQKLRAFITQIDSLIADLEGKIRQLSTHHEHQRDTWMKQRSRAEAMDGVADRALKQELDTEESTLQREIDDRVSAKPTA